MVIPANTFLSNAVGEKYIWDVFQRYDYEELMSFHSLIISDEKYQFLGISDKGFIIGVIFGFKTEEVKKLDDKHLKLTSGTVISSPINLLLNQRQRIITDIKDGSEIDISEHLSIIVFCPLLSSDDIKRIGLCDNVPEKYFVTREVIEDSNELKKRIIMLIQELCDVKGEIRECDIQIVKEFLKSKYPKEEQIVEAPLEMELQIVSKKEVYYEILSFLLMNDITSGRIISCEKWMLDGIATYMSERKIPWYYSGNDGIGYELSDENDTSNYEGKAIVIEKKAQNTYKISVGKNLQLPIEIYEPPEVIFDIDQIPLHLKNEQIREVFLKTFEVARDEIDIISPWMNFYAVDEEVIEKMEAALAKGVKIRIIYGLKDNNESFERNRSFRSDQVAEHLLSRFSEYGPLFQIHRDNIHYKLVLCDELYKLEGGFNYLSFEGDYSKGDVRKEGSPFGRNRGEIEYLRKEYFSNGWD